MQLRIVHWLQQKIRPMLFVVAAAACALARASNITLHSETGPNAAVHVVVCLYWQPGVKNKWEIIDRTNTLLTA